MDTKLTLNVDKEIIMRAKKYAKRKNVSLSHLIESYLASLISSDEETEQISPLVKSLSGVIKLDSDFDYKEGYSDYLRKKYE